MTQDEQKDKIKKITELINNGELNEALNLANNDAATLVMIGLLLAKKGNRELAEKVFDGIVRVNPGDAKAWNMRGIALANLGRLEEALSSFDEAIRMNACYAEAWSNKGAALGNMRRIEEALTCLDEAIKINPRLAEAWGTKGKVLGDLGRREEALRCYDEAISINPDSADMRYNKGVELARLTKYQEALECFDKATKINSGYAEAWNNKGVTLGSLRKYGEALGCFDEAIEINPNLAQAWYNKGMNLDALGKYVEALECFEEAIKRSPSYAEAWRDKGVELGRLGKYGEAIRSFDESLKIDPNAALTFHNRGIAFLNLHDYNRAKDDLMKARTLESDKEIGARLLEADVLGYMGGILSFLGRYRDAKEHHEQALRAHRAVGNRQGIANDLSNLSGVLYSMDRWNKTVERANQALKIHLDLRDERGEAADRGNIGLALLGLGKPNEAMEYLKQALKIHRRILDRQGEANDLAGIGNVHNAQSNWKEAIENLNPALKIHEEIGDMKGAANDSGSIGIVLSEQGKWRESIELEKKALELHKQIAYGQGVANDHLNWGANLLYLGRWNEAVEHINQALETYRAIKNKKAEGAALGDLGFALLKLGRWSEAIRQFNEALKIHRKLGDKQSIAKTLANISAALGSVGKWKESTFYQKRALNMHRRIGDKQGVAGDLNNIGEALFSLGKYNQSLQCRKQSLEIFRSVGHSKGEADTLDNIGVVLRILGRQKEAMSYHEQALNIYRELGDTEGETGCLGNIGMAFYEMRLWNEAIEYFEQSLRKRAEIGDTVGESRSLAGLGYVSLAHGDFDGALKYFDECIKLLENLRYGVSSSDLKVSFKSQYLEVYDGAVFACHGKSITARNGATEEGRKKFGGEWDRKCLNYAESSKSTVTVEDLEATILPHQAGIVSWAPTPRWRSFVDKLQETRGNRERMTEIENMLKCGLITAESFEKQKLKINVELTSLAEHLADLRLELYSAGADPGLMSPPRSYDIVTESLNTLSREEDGWGLLEFVILPEFRKLLVFLLVKEERHRKDESNQDKQISNGDIVRWICETKDDVDPAKLKKNCLKVFKAIKLINDGDLEKADSILSKMSEVLSKDLIFGKVKDALNGKLFEHLVVVPHRWLNYVPFEILSLENNRDTIPLGLKFALSRSHSLDLLRIAVQKRELGLQDYRQYTRGEDDIGQAGIGSTPIRVLAFENPKNDLPFAQKEVQELKTILTTFADRNHKKLTKEQFTQVSNSEATKSMLKSHAGSIPPWHVFHYAGHAEFDEDEPMMSNLKLSDGELPAYEILNEVAFRGCPLVYLSACETGLSQVRKGDEAFGLIRALMLSGSSTIIASYWSVSDECAILYAKRFYQGYLLEGKSVAEALRAAREDLYNEYRSSPSFWASFTLYGDPFRRLQFNNANETSSQ